MMVLIILFLWGIWLLMLLITCFKKLLKLYTSVKGAKVVTNSDRATGHSKGYGFVWFGDKGEQLHSMTEMNGQYFL